MKILFMGGTGNISADCAARLHADGHEIAVMTRGNRPIPPAYRSVVADRSDPAAVCAALHDESFDAVIDFLAFDVADLETCATSMAGRCGQYVFISSATVYAKPHSGALITEATPTGNPYSPYAQKKRACETWLIEHAGAFPATIVRPSHTYSKRWIPNTVSSAGYALAERIEQGRALFVPAGATQWTLTATTDFAAGLAGLVGNSAAVGEVFHITGDEALTWREIYGETASALGVACPEIIDVPVDFICEHFPGQVAGLRGDKANQTVFDNAKLRRFVPGFACRKPFRAGIKEAVDFMRENPAEKNINPVVSATFDAVIDAWKGR